MGWIDGILTEIVTELVKKFIWWVLTEAYTKFSLIRGLEDDAAKLRRTHKLIQRFLNAESLERSLNAESSDIEQETVRGWVGEMKNFTFDAENLIDELQRLVDVIKLTKEAPSRKRKFPVPSFGGLNTLFKRRRIAKDIVKIENRLDEIHEIRRNRQLKPSSDGQRRSDGSNEIDYVPAVATFDEFRIVGRSKEFKSVVAAPKADPDLDLSSHLEENNSACPTLTISSHQLNYELMQCFAFCSIFPDNYEFGKDELVRMWIAQGLIQEANGSVLFNYLLSMSFFEPSTKPCSSKTTCKYTMPKLIRRLACSLSKNELLVMKDNKLNPPSGQFHYGSLFHRNEQILFEKLYVHVNLRMLKLINESGVGVGRIPEDLFNKLKYLRLLDLSNSGIEELPDSVGKLVHLRYLGLARTNVKELPESVENLYNLQTLDLKFCYNLSSLPLGTSNLVNLRRLILHLDWERINDLSPMPTGINYLTSLKTLSRFTVTKEDGCNLRELKDLDLHGELCICKLENVTNESDAKEANLRAKGHIDKLMLRWSDDTSSVQQGATTWKKVVKRKLRWSDDTSSVQQGATTWKKVVKRMLRWSDDTSSVQQGTNTWKKVADELRPHEYLKCLWIMNYPGSEFPNWLADTSFSSIETVRLSCSEECESLPPLGLLPKLKHLHIEGMKKLRNLENMKGFPSLKTLTIKDMPVLETFCEFVDGEFPELIQIVISECPNLPDTDRLNIPGRIDVSRN